MSSAFSIRTSSGESLLKELQNETPHRLYENLSKGPAGHDGAAELRQSFRPRAQPARTREDARFADQRLRVLPRHAFQGCTRGGRDRAAALLAQRLARGAFLQRAGARRARMDRSDDAADRR